MNRIAKSFIIVSAMLFVSAFIPTPHLQAAIFDGSISEGEGAPIGFCLTNPNDPDYCQSIVDCTTDDDKDNLLCMTETQAGTGLAATSLSTTGITHTDNLGNYIKKLVNFSLPYLVLAAFVGYVVAGFMYVTAFGNDEQLGKAKKIIIWVSVGLILVMLSYAITNLLTGGLVEGLENEPTRPNVRTIGG